MISCRRLPIAGLLLALLAAPAAAETIEIRMLNRGQHGSMVFEPDHIELKPGDTLQFRASDRSHNAASIDGMAPEGFAGFKGKIDQEIAVTFDKPGYYGIKCSPHFGMGMVMLVRVGAAPMPEGFRDVEMPERARKRFDEILARAKPSAK